MVKVGNNYSTSNYYNSAQQTRTKENASSEKTDKAGASGQAGQSRLSAKAQALLERLNSTYGNIDFLVADFDKGDNAKDVLARSTKEVSVVLSSEELERMAADEKYEQEYLSRVQQSLHMSERINQEFGFESAFGKDTSGTTVTKIGISFNSDGTTTFFAELEKMSEKQRERIAKAREERLADKKAQEKKAERKKQEENSRIDNRGQNNKRTSLQANSIEELLEKIRAVDWDTIKARQEPESGGRFDYSI